VCPNGACVYGMVRVYFKKHRVCIWYGACVYGVCIYFNGVCICFEKHRVRVYMVQEAQCVYMVRVLLVKRASLACH